MAHKAVEMKRSERSDAEIQLSKQVVQTFLNGGSDLHQETSSPRHLPMSEFVFQVAKYLQPPFGLYEQILKPNNIKLL